jgi:hypothetical protein
MIPATLNRRRFALLLALGGMAGCASTQPQGTVMIIDKPQLKNADFSRPIMLLPPNEYKEDQQALRAGMEAQLRGKFLITAQRIRLIRARSDIGQIASPQFRMDINSIMYQIDDNADLIFENNTMDNPYINIWKTGGTAPEYTAIGYYTPPLKILMMFMMYWLDIFNSSQCSREVDKEVYY